jgi:hypothetical protein
MKNPENAVTTPMRKLLKWQAVFLAILAIASTVGGIWLTIDSYGYTLISIPVALVVCYLFMKISGLVSTFILKRIFYGSDTESFMNDAKAAFEAHDLIKKEITTSVEQNTTTDAIMIKILRTSESVLARYMDHDIFDWIEIADVNDNPVRLSFIGTMDLSKGLQRPVPSGCMLIEPGILYGTEEALIANPA